MGSAIEEAPVLFGSMLATALALSLITSRLPLDDKLQKPRFGTSVLRLWRLLHITNYCIFHLLFPEYWAHLLALSAAFETGEFFFSGCLRDLNSKTCVKWTAEGPLSEKIKHGGLDLVANAIGIGIGELVLRVSKKKHFRKEWRELLIAGLAFLLLLSMKW